VATDPKECFLKSTSNIVRGVLQAWGRILIERQPSLSIEITRECPLQCPGCYAYGDAHLGGDVTLRGLSDYRGEELIERFIRVIDSRRPLHVSIVGGEPLVRFRELNSILPALAARNIHTQLVTSAVRPIPSEWASLRRLQIVVSIDGLPPEHDQRRTPATYDRILKHIAGHQITVHCTVTRQQVRRAGYLEEFLRFWQANVNTRMIWVSLYTPRRGEISAERLTATDRQLVIDELRRLRPAVPKLEMFDGALAAYAQPPASPAECAFARTTECLSADLERRIVPCQFGGNPDCSSCGCVASASLEAIARHRLPGGILVRQVFNASFSAGNAVSRLRKWRRTTAPSYS
jgi:sulfatase maturation enzyme AslB (radical SAM superfamily)